MTTTTTDPPIRAATDPTRFDVVVAVLCAMAQSVGAFKGTPVLSWLPVDATVLAVGLLVALVVGRFVVDPGRLTVSLGGVVVVAAFLPAALAHVPVGYQDEKLQGMVVTLAIVVTSASLLTTPARRRAWLWALGLIGVFMAIAVDLLPRDDSVWGRASLEGSNTIATGRVTGTAIVVFATFMFWRGARHRWLLGIAVVLTAAALVDSGSRGPVLFAAASVAVMVVLHREGRLVKMLALAIGLVVGAVAATSDYSAGATRLGLVLTGEATGTEARQPLWAAAWRAMGDWPGSFWGTGWGGFVSVLPVGDRLDTGDRQYPHNFVLEAFTEGGWIAGVAILAFVVLSLVRLRRAVVDRDSLAMFSVAVFAVLNACVSGDLGNNRLAWVVLALAWVAQDSAAAVSTPEVPSFRSSTAVRDRPGSRASAIT